MSVIEYEIKDTKKQRDFYRDLCEVKDIKINQLQQENQQLKAKYNEVLKMLAEHYPPCELDGFMDKNTDYCSVNCGVDEEIFKKCWDRYITQRMEVKDDGKRNV